MNRPLEAYSRRENLKFEGIPEVSQYAEAGTTTSEDTKEVLVNFLENMLGFENVKHIEFQRVHRLGKPKEDTGNDGHTITARFLRFSDKEQVFKQGRKLKGTKLISKCLRTFQRNYINKLLLLCSFPDSWATFCVNSFLYFIYFCKASMVF